MPPHPSPARPHPNPSEAHEPGMTRRLAAQRVAPAAVGEPRDAAAATTECGPHTAPAVEHVAAAVLQVPASFAGGAVGGASCRDARLEGPVGGHRVPGRVRATSPPLQSSPARRRCLRACLAMCRPRRSLQHRWRRRRNPALTRSRPSLRRDGGSPTPSSRHAPPRRRRRSTRRCYPGQGSPRRRHRLPSGCPPTPEHQRGERETQCGAVQ